MPKTKKTTTARKTEPETNEKPMSEGAMAFLDMAQDVGFSAMGSTDASDITDYLPTFIPSLDLIMGGGVPFRRFNEIFGAAGVGKSTFLVYLTMIASQLGIPIFWIDTEGTTGDNRLAEFDVDMRYVKVYDPTKLAANEIMSIEKIDTIIESLVKNYLNNPEYNSTPSIIFWDSVAGTISQEEAETAIDKDGRMGRSANALTKLTKRVTPMLNKCNISIIVTNQVRSNLNAFSSFQKQTTRASNAKSLDHAETIRLGLDRLKTLTGMTAISRGVVDNNGRNKVGHEVKFTADKNKAGVSEQTTKLDDYTSELISENPYLNLSGFDFPECITTDAIGAGVISNTGGYYTFITKDGEKIKKRRKDFLVMLHSDDELMKDLFTQTLEFYFPERYPAINNKNIDITKFKYWTPELTEKYRGVTKGIV